MTAAAIKHYRANYTAELIAAGGDPQVVGDLVEKLAKEVERDTRKPAAQEVFKQMGASGE